VLNAAKRALTSITLVTFAGGNNMTYYLHYVFDIYEVVSQHTETFHKIIDIKDINIEVLQEASYCWITDESGYPVKVIKSRGWCKVDDQSISKLARQTYEKILDGAIEILTDPLQYPGQCALIFDHDPKSGVNEKAFTNQKELEALADYYRINYNWVVCKAYLHPDDLKVYRKEF
jgi:hypothetical protein